MLLTVCTPLFSVVFVTFLRHTVYVTVITFKTFLPTKPSFRNLKFSLKKILISCCEFLNEIALPCNYFLSQLFYQSNKLGLI